MTDLSYTDSGQPAPASGGPKGFAYFKAIFDYIFAKVNGHWNNTTPTNQHLSGVILANDAAHTLTTTRALTGSTQFSENDLFRRQFLELLDGDFTASTYASRAVPNTIKGLNTTVAAATSTTTPGALVKWDATTGGITPAAATLSRNAVAELGASATVPPSLSVSVHSGIYVDRTGANPTARFLPVGITTNHAAPATGQERYDVVSLNLATAGVSTLAGTPAALGTAGFPTPANATDEILYYVYNRAGQTSIKDTFDGVNGYIISVALHNLGGISVVGGTVITNAVLGIGSGTPTNIVPILTGAETGTINSVNFDAVDASGMFTNKGWGALRTGAATDGSLADTLRDYTGDAASRVYLQSNAAHYSAASWFPGTLVINGRARTVTAEPTAATASGSAGPRYLIADLSGAGPGFTLTSPMPNVDTSSETGYKRALAIFLWDGTTLHLMADSVYDTSPLATIPSHQVSPTTFALPAGSTSSDTLTTADAVLNGMSGTLTLTKPSRVRFMAIVGYSGTGAPGTYNATFTIYVTGGPIAPGPLTSFSALAPQTGSVTGSAQIVTNRVQLEAGQYTVSVQGHMSNVAAAFTVFGNTKFLEAEVGN